MSPEEYIKLLNTHACGCFVSELYPRFHISLLPLSSADLDDTDTDDCDDDASGTDTDGGSTDDDDGSDTTESSTDAGDTSDCEDDDMLSTIEYKDTNDDADVGGNDADVGGNDNSFNAATAVRTSTSSRRLLKSPHPDVGISSPPSNNKKKNKPSKLESLIAEMNNVEQHNNNATASPQQQKQVARCRRFYPSIATSRYIRATTFMKHSPTCGSHKQDIVAKDIHTGTNKLIFHARSYNIHHKKDIVRSRDYLLPYSPAVPSAGTAASTTTSHTKKQKKPTTAAAEQHHDNNDSNDAMKEDAKKQRKH